jgi:hypothetical protein
MADYYSLSLPVATLPELESNPTLVLPSSPTIIRKRVELFAKYFKREMHFDFPQFEAAETPDKSWYVPYEAYLFHKSADDLWHGEGPIKHRFFGACCFRWREYTNAPAEWSLDWVWFHPYFRCRGHLQSAWPRFAEKYGHFDLAQPLSCGMEKFLQKINWQLTHAQ